MARTYSRSVGRSRRHERARGALREKGWAACVLGVALLTVFPLVAGNTIFGAAVTQGLRPVGWTALGLGVVLLALHYALKGKESKLRAVPPANSRPAAQTRNGRAPLQTANSVASHPAADASNAAQRTEPTLTDTAAPAATPAGPAVAWNMEVFAAIEWRRFEAVCEALFAQAGFETHAQSHGADGGVDIWLHSRNSPGPAAVVQCKHWQSKPVGVRELREFYGVMASHKLKRGTFATTSTYTPEALAFARANSIHTLDGAGLLQLISRRTPAQQQELLQVAYEGEYWRPTCASCGTKMVERSRSSDGGLFWGCTNYPRCKRTLPKATGG